MEQPSTETESHSYVIVFRRLKTHRTGRRTVVAATRMIAVRKFYKENPGTLIDHVQLVDVWKPCVDCGYAVRRQEDLWVDSDGGVECPGFGTPHYATS